MFRRAVIVVNRSKSGALEFAQTFCKKIEAHFQNITIFDHYPISADYFNKCDLCITIGGDGTLLGVAPILAKQNIPVFVINHGSLGFLSTTDTQNAVDSIKEIQIGKFNISERMLLKASFLDHEALALNEFVIRGSNHSRTAKFVLECDNTQITHYVADGIIIATPTGSTAYNISAGGPIVHPKIDTILATPICPHTGHKTTLVLPSNSIIKIQNTIEELATYCDSNHIGNISNIQITAYKFKLKILQLLRYSFFDTLSRKLGF